MSIGAGGNNAAIIPSLGIVLVGAGADWNDLQAGDPSSKINRARHASKSFATHCGET